MRIIDRYLLRQFLQTYLICYLSLTGLYIIFDAFTNLDDFLRCADRSHGLLKMMGAHYAYQAIGFFDRTSGLLALVSAMFTLTWIQRHNEMTALMSAGISRMRVVAPVIVAAVVISMMATTNREVVIPRIRNELARRPTDPLGDVGQELHPRYDNQTDILIRGKATYAARNRIEKPDFLLPDSLSHYAKQLVADNAFYQAAQGERPAGYMLENVQQPKDLGSRPSLVLDGKPLIITPRDAPDWLKPNQCFLVSDLAFEQVAGSRGFRQFASTRELIAGLRNHSNDFGADIRVAIHGRIVNPLLDITLFFLGLPLVVSSQSRNVFLAIGLCMGVTTVFLLVVIAFQQMGSIYLVGPALAAWAPLMIFVPVAVGMAQSMWD